MDNREKDREEYQKLIDAYVPEAKAKKYEVPPKLINPVDVLPSEDFSDKEEAALVQLGLDRVIQETVDPNAGDKERMAYQFKNAPMVEFSQDGKTGFRITPYYAHFIGSDKVIESGEFLEVWKAHFAGIHNDLALAREKLERESGPDYRALLSKYIAKFEQVYGISGVEHDSTLLMKDGGFNLKEALALQELHEESSRTDGAEHMEPEQKPNAVSIRRKEEPPSFLESFINRFKRPSEPPKDTK